MVEGTYYFTAIQQLLVSAAGSLYIELKVALLLVAYEAQPFVLTRGLVLHVLFAGKVDLVVWDLPNDYFLKMLKFELNFHLVEYIAEAA